MLHLCSVFITVCLIDYHWFQFAI